MWTVQTRVCSAWHVPLCVEGARGWGIKGQLGVAPSRSRDAWRDSLAVRGQREVNGLDVERRTGLQMFIFQPFLYSLSSQDTSSLFAHVTQYNLMATRVNSGTRWPEFKTWLCPLFLGWPRVNHFTRGSSSLICKTMIVTILTLWDMKDKIVPTSQDCWKIKGMKKCKAHMLSTLKVFAGITVITLTCWPASWTAS